jgi:hypothetical protein
MMYAYGKMPKKIKWLEKASHLLIVSGILCVLAGCASESQHSSYPPNASQASRGEQRTFATPEQAVEALVTATRENRRDDLLKILGPDAHQIIYSGDKVADQEGRDRFVSAYDRAHEIRSDDAGHDTLVVGEEEWPLPIPLVHAENGWTFDTAAGQEEILNRRIGRNELNVLEVCRVYVEAQQEFSALHANGKRHHEYAQHFQSSPDQHDGLYWPAADGQPISPLGPFLASAAEEGYSGKVFSKRTPYHGYYYRILKSQGAHASGGAKDYIVDGHMRRGFALIAFPARYDDSGVMTFIVNQDGIVYEKNLGFDTAEIASITREFDPDDSWNIVRQ